MNTKQLSSDYQQSNVVLSMEKTEVAAGLVTTLLLSQVINEKQTQLEGYLTLCNPPPAIQ